MTPSLSRGPRATSGAGACIRPRGPSRDTRPRAAFSPEPSPTGSGSGEGSRTFGSREGSLRTFRSTSGRLRGQDVLGGVRAVWDEHREGVPRRGVEWNLAQSRQIPPAEDEQRAGCDCRHPRRSRPAPSDGWALRPLRSGGARGRLQEGPRPPGEPAVRRFRPPGGGGRGSSLGVRRLAPVGAPRDPRRSPRVDPPPDCRGSTPRLRRPSAGAAPSASRRRRRAPRGSHSTRISLRAHRRVPGHRPGPGRRVHAHLRSGRRRPGVSDGERLGRSAGRRSRRSGSAGCARRDVGGGDRRRRARDDRAHAARRGRVPVGNRLRPARPGGRALRRR